MEKQVILTLKKGSDGHWLSFESKSGKKCTINIENVFPGKTISDTCIREWADDQFTNCTYTGIKPERPWDCKSCENCTWQKKS
jgi:hypothetical protein